MLAEPMVRLLLVCAGGALGSGARYLVSVAWPAGLGPGMPWATLAINVSGSFLISVVMYLFSPAGLVGEDARWLLAAGVLGGFTTYSSFNFEVLSLAQRGVLGLAAGYVAATVAGGLVAGLAGWWLARAVTSAL
jgi:CrcB protein